MKKLLLCSLLAACLIFTGCQNTKDSSNTNENKDTTQTTTQPQEEKKTVTVTTSFLYDMVNQLAGDLVNRELIIPAGSDPHIYEPKPSDLDKLNKADLVLYHGLHFEGKMIEVLESKGKSVSANFPKEKIGEMEEDGQVEIDPHFWFDISLYKLATEEASKQLEELLPESKDVIKANLEKYLAELDKLDQENKTALDQISKDNRFLVTPHDAFNYFSRCYNIEVVAPQGVSTDSEVANKDIEDTAKFIADHKIKAIFAESTTSPERMKKLQEVVKSFGHDVKVVSGEGHELFSDSLAPEGEDGDTFIDMYRHNVKLIVDNLK